MPVSGSMVLLVPEEHVMFLARSGQVTPTATAAVLSMTSANVMMVLEPEPKVHLGFQPTTRVQEESSAD